MKYETKAVLGAIIFSVTLGILMVALVYGVLSLAIQ